MSDPAGVVDRLAAELLWRFEQIRSTQSARDEAQALLDVIDGAHGPSDGALELWRRMTADDLGRADASSEAPTGEAEAGGREG